MRLDVDMEIKDAIEYLGLEECEFDDECDFCDSPKNGSFVSLSISECGTEANYYICGDCCLSQATEKLLTHNAGGNSTAKA